MSLKAMGDLISLTDILRMSCLEYSPKAVSSTSALITALSEAISARVQQRKGRPGRRRWYGGSTDALLCSRTLAVLQLLAHIARPARVWLSHRQADWKDT